MIQTFDEIKKTAMAEHKAEKEKIKQRKILINLQRDQFDELFETIAETYMMKRGTRRKFEFTESNTRIINQLFYYFTYSDKFEGNHDNGIMLAGKNGTGKTLIMSVFIKLISLSGNKIVRPYHSKELALRIKDEEKLKEELKRPLFVDDLGKEALEINHYGTKIQPIADLFALRYDYGAQTLATTNYNFDTLTEFYGVTITDRWRETFNVFVLNGESFRK